MKGIKEGIKRIIRNRLSLKFILVCTLLFTSIFIAVNSKQERIKASEPVGTYNINSKQDLIDYSIAYASGDRNPEDTLIIAINSGDKISDLGFISIGTSARPFSGTIQTPVAGATDFLLFNIALFDYVSTDLTLTGPVNIQRANATNANDSLFANHVVKGTNSADWKILLNDYSFTDEGVEASTKFASVIGEIEANAEVTIEFTNDSSLNVEASSNAGLIVGTLKTGATLNVKTQGTATNVSVTSLSGHAGSLVGEMERYSTLKFLSGNNTNVVSVTSASNKSAGGLVGFADDVTIDNTSVTNYHIKGTITGQNAGGVFGYYRNRDDSSFDLSTNFDIESGTTIKGSSYSGGIFGQFVNNSPSFTFNGNKTGSESININISSGSYRGGIFGTISDNNLAHTVTIENTDLIIDSSSNSGGVIGRITNATYVSINNVYVTSSTLVAGLVYVVEDIGAFIDLTDEIHISVPSMAGSSNYDAGLIYRFSSGILRMNGLLDMSVFKSKSHTSAYLVKEADRALIYALGNGTTGWTFKRNMTNAIDDIGSWGETLLVDGTTLKESDLFIVSSANHTVEVLSPQTTLSSATDFAKTSFNMKLNTSGDIGALKFESTTTSSSLLTQTYTIGADINLENTGILGLTRDDGKNSDFTGTINGGNHTISLAIGKSYGLNENGAALGSDSKQGKIYGYTYNNAVNHKYNGLIPNLGSSTISNLKIGGYARIYQNKETSLYVGGLAGTAKGNITLNNVSSSLEFDYMQRDDNTGYYGGLFGTLSSDFNVSITSGTIKPTFTDSTESSVSANSVTHVGGVIGYIHAGSSQSLSLSGSTIGIDYSVVNNNKRLSAFGSLYSETEVQAYSKDARTITLTNVAVEMDVVGVTASSKFGAILAMHSFAFDITITGLNISDVSITQKSTSSSKVSNYGGLFQSVTGRLDILSIDITTCNFDISNNSSSSFGFVANRTYNSTSGKTQALYLDIVDATYNINNLTFTTQPTSFTGYDEIVCNSRYNTTALSSNGNSIISITTAGNVIDTDSPYNTYINRTAFGKTTGFINKNTRYYYNVKYARENYLTENKLNFFVFSLNTYAQTSIKSWFVSTNYFTGDLDMTGISYYPVNLTTSITFNNANIKLDNILMDNSVKIAYTGTLTRTTKSTSSQHYTMHAALFRNVTGSITFTGNNTMSGNVPRLSDTFSGFLVASTLGGGSKTTNIVCNENSTTTLNGLYIHNNGNHLTNTTFAPLLIHTISSNTTLTLIGFKQSTTDYSTYATNGYYAASSLIGNVGSTTDKGIYLTFSKLMFDARKSNVDGLSSAYGTDRSIFSCATLLNSFLYEKESIGTYNFEQSEDWESSSSAVHKVTYGYELSGSSQYEDEEQYYYNSTIYTHPTQYNAGSPFTFTSYLRYVYTEYNHSESKYELSVNRTSTSTMSGCGKYNDPYIIDSDDALSNISKMIRGETGVTVTFNIPSTFNSKDYTTRYVDNSGNCLHQQVTYEYITGDYNTTEITTNISYALVREYLAGAYYKISKDITLSSSYDPLGYITSDNDIKYTFRGVIIGDGSTITNKSNKPLIATSYGSVVKGIKVVVNPEEAISLTTPSKTDAIKANGGASTYGAIFGKILGGDNIIDQVQVEFENAIFTYTTPSSAFNKLIPIGGYVGVLFNGGLIFRNMENTETFSNVGLTSSTNANVNETSGYLYVNPIIGRVVAGYAFHETSEMNLVEEDAIIKNGLKNYTICDLTIPSSDSEKLDVTSSWTINVPDGRALFILSALVNSGAASASNATAIYQNITDWSGYNLYSSTRGGSNYSTVGSTNASDYQQSTEYSKAQNDKYTGNGILTPYIVRAYTKAYNNNTNYYVRAVSANTTNKVYIKADCDVPAGFRGLGNFYYSNNYLKLRLYSFNGNNHNINLNMRYLEYDHYTCASYALAYVPNANVSGFGLFTTLELNTPNDTNSVNNFSLSGKIYYDIYNTNTGTKITDYGYDIVSSTSDVDLISNQASVSGYVNPKENGVNKKTYLSVGGVAGKLHTKAFEIVDVTFNEFYIEGVKSTGGLVGMLYNLSGTSMIKYTKSSSSSGFVDVKSGLQAGGLVGLVLQAPLDIVGYADNTPIKVKEIVLKGTTLTEAGRKYYGNTITGCGGLIGSAFSNYKATGDIVVDSLYDISMNKPDTRRLSITNMTVTKSDKYSARIYTNSTAVLACNYAGGLIGSVSKSVCTIIDSNVTNVSIEANMAGGLIGRAPYRPYIYVTNVNVTTTNSDSISGVRYAGGMIGLINNREQYRLIVNGFKVEGYTIEATSTTSPSGNTKDGTLDGIAAGGLIGNIGTDKIATNDVANTITELNDITVKDVTVRTLYTQANNQGGVGGLIGSVLLINVDDNNNSSVSSNQMKISGYNIMLDGVSISQANSGSTMGVLVGNNYQDSAIRFIGVYFDSSSYTGKMVGKYNDTKEHFGAISDYKGFVILANSTGVDTNHEYASVNDASTVNDDYFNPAYKATPSQINANNNIYKFENGVYSSYSGSTPKYYISPQPNNPYVISNHSTLIGSNRLNEGGNLITGDGISQTVETLPINQILSTDNRYSYSKNAYYSGNSGNTNSTVFSNYASKLALFSTEVSGYSGNDFALIVADDSDAGHLTEMINSYIRLLTNTTFDYALDSTDFTVVIYNMVYDESTNTFIPSSEGASLRRTGGQFNTLSSVFDSGKVQFSLIDIRFHKPANTVEEAYHLYVPVFVKKVLTYSFDISIKSGTTYDEAIYTPFGAALIENVGTPITAFFKYSYSRTLEEWQNAIYLDGENVHRTYEKELIMSKPNATSTDLLGDTILVLVDANRGGKVYYSTIKEALNGSTLSLSAFKSGISKSYVLATSSQISNPNIQKYILVDSKYMPASDSDEGDKYVASYSTDGFSESFTPVTLDELLTLVVTLDAEGELVKENNAELVTVVVNGEGYRKYNPETDESITERYALECTGVSEEKYYLTVLTESSQSYSLFHYYYVTTPSAFKERNYPSKISDTNEHTMVHLVMGKIFSHTDFEISTTSMNGTDVMKPENNRLDISLESTFSLSDNLDGSLRENMKSLVRSTNVFQSFILNLTRTSGAEVTKAIIGNPTPSGEYSIVHNDNTDANATNRTYSNMVVNQSYAEFKTPNISSHFAEGDAFTISANVSLTYSNEAIIAQFPGRDDVLTPDNGVRISGSSNVAFTLLGTTYTKNTISGDDANDKSYISEQELQIATLNLNPIGDKLGDINALGINALNNFTDITESELSTTATFSLFAALDITFIASELEEYKNAYIEITLTQKGNDGLYGDNLPISTYIREIKVGNTNMTMNGTTASLTISKSLLTDNGAEISLPQLVFKVITGEDFEAQGLKYGNFKITASVVLLDENDNSIGITQSSDYVVYTNTKIKPDYIPN